MQGRPQRSVSVRRRVWTAVALTLLAVYVAWNLYWLACGRVPPSILWKVTGIPSPTTGGTGSFLALLHGRWADSLRLNAMTLPIAALFSASLATLAWQLVWHRRARLPGIFLPAWVAVLVVAWILKLLA